MRGDRVVDIITEEGFLDQVSKIGNYLFDSLKKVKDGRIVTVRGWGLMLGVEFKAEIKELVEICIQKGLLLVGAGPRVLRFVPPLTVNKSEIDQAVEIFREALKEWNS